MVSFTCRQFQKLIPWLYDGSILFITRKRDKAISQLKHRGFLKFREFGGTPEKDNTEPSLERNLLEGVETMVAANPEMVCL